MKIEMVGNLKTDKSSWKNPQRGIVYYRGGVIGCLNGMGFRNNHPKILEIYED
jgi:hypothetical protein